MDPSYYQFCCMNGLLHSLLGEFGPPEVDTPLVVGGHPPAGGGGGGTTLFCALFELLLLNIFGGGAPFPLLVLFEVGGGFILSFPPPFTLLVLLTYLDPVPVLAVLAVPPTFSFSQRLLLLGGGFITGEGIKLSRLSLPSGLPAGGVAIEKVHTPSSALLIRARIVHVHNAYW